MIRGQNPAASVKFKKPGPAVAYMLQAGSFRDFAQADKLKAQLALLGIEAKIEPAKIGDTRWNRVRIGPVTSIARLDSIRQRLRQNKIGVMVQSAR